jgi:hypothetical protein
MYTIGQYKDKLEAALTMLLIEHCRVTSDSVLDKKISYKMFHKYENDFICKMSHSSETLRAIVAVSSVFESVKEKQNKITNIFSPNDYHSKLVRETLPQFWRDITKIVDDYFYAEANEN